MPEDEPKIDSLQELRIQFESLRDNHIETSRSSRRAIETLAALQAALPAFELGLKLGKEISPESEAFIGEVQKYLQEREQEIGEQLYPSRRPR